MRRFYAPKIAQNGDITGDEANHIINVLRMREGDSAVLFDGSGRDYFCRIAAISKNTVSFAVEKKEYNTNEPKTKITLYSAAIKKDKLDIVFQKVSELGVDSFCVYDAHRSVKKIKDAEKTKEHLTRIAVEAAKQCGRSRIPNVEILKSTKSVADRVSSHDCVIFAYEEEKSHSLAEVVSGDIRDVGIVIGPEGGFEKEEADMLISSGARVCSLGKLILRAETAGIAAVSMVLCMKETL